MNLVDARTEGFITFAIYAHALKLLNEPPKAVFRHLSQVPVPHYGKTKIICALR